MTRWILVLALLFAPACYAAEDFLLDSLQKGEDLGTFSQRIYGTTRRWRQILEWNRDQIKDPNLLHVGMQLRVLPKEKLGPLPAPTELAPVAAAPESLSAKPEKAEPKKISVAPGGSQLKKFNELEVDK